MGRFPVTRDLPAPLLDCYGRVATDAITDAGLGHHDIDGLFVSPAALSADPWMMFGANLAEYLGLATKRLGVYENGGCTSMLALTSAVEAVRAGACVAALVVAADTRPTMEYPAYDVFLHEMVRMQMSMHGVVDGLYGIGAPVPFYAMCTQRYMQEFDVGAEAIAQVAVLLRSHAVKNEYAQFRDAVDVDGVLGSKMISPPVHLLESASVSSGAVALVVVPGAEAGEGSVSVLAHGEHHTPTHFMPTRASLTTFEANRLAADEAFAHAGVGRGDIDVAEVYGVFAGTELITYEDLGFCDKGAAWRAVAEGHTTFGAKTVLNPSGGRLSLGHPAGVTPLYEVAEVVAQLRGQAGDIQVDGAELGLVQAEHGVMNGSTVLILGARS